MRLILEGNGRLAIDVVGQGGDAAPDSSSDPSCAAPAFITEKFTQEVNLGALATVEEALFVSVIFLLKRHYERTGIVPTRRILEAVREVFESLFERGDLHRSTSRDTVFLAKLLAVIDQLTDRDAKPFLTELAVSIRKMLIDDDNSVQPDDPSGNGEPSGGNGEPSGNGEPARKSKKPGGDNGTPSKG